MIGSLRGVVLERRNGEVLLEVGGVGYRVQLVASAFGRLPSGGAEVFVYVHHHIREDHQALYGFLSAAERDCFESLIAAHGVGPTLAMAILAVHRPDQLVQVLADGDVAALCQVPGVGKKTAARLLVELRAKLDVDTFLVGPLDGAARPGAGPGAAPVAVLDSPRAVVRQALAELGYGAEEIRTALDGLGGLDGAAAEDGGGMDEATLLRAALLRLAGGR
ncbi:MAG: Holliday junction branch migration protein RuvA [Acidimicrobiales bacterium]